MQPPEQFGPILIVDDEPEIVDLVSYHIAAAGYQVLTASTGREAIEIAGASRPALMILDVLLPDMSGLDVLSALRNPDSSRSVPCLMLSALRDDMDRIRGLELGADDYLTKPFNPDELVLRVGAILRRTSAQRTHEPMEVIGPITIDRGGRRVFVAGTEVALTPTEYRLLLLMAENPDLAQRRDQLLEIIWGAHPDTHTRTVDVHILRLRTKLGAAADMLQTVRGFGYRLTTPAAGEE